MENIVIRRANEAVEYEKKRVEEESASEIIKIKEDRIEAKDE